MAKISSRLVFVTTSPRTLEKVIPEIALLSDNFSGQKWNADTQTRYMELLRDEDFFHGEGCNDPAFSARDRITRTPKALGFVRLHPCIELTEGGRALLSSPDKPDIFLRQLLKYQLPSPYHRLSDDAVRFNVKPFLEVLRLVRVLGKLRFDELRAIGLQMTDWHEFPDIVCDYGDFMVCVEATLQSGQRQYESEGEPVSRHLGKLKKQSGKPCYALFVAPSINDACVAHFFALHNMNISYYGGHSVIVPLPLELFRVMLHASGSVASRTSVEDIRRFFEYSEWLARRCGSEIEWYEGIKSMAAAWPDSLSYA